MLYVWKPFLLLGLVGVMSMCLGGDEISAQAKIPVVLGVGQMVRLASGGPAITFVGVSEDSRCAKGLHCIWAGQAKVDLYVGEAGSGESLQVTIPGMKDEVEVSAATGGLTILCSKLAPYPEAETPVDKNEYKLTLTFK